MTSLPLELTWPQAFALSLTLACIGSALHDVELLSIRRELAAGGWLSWSVLRTSHPRLMRSPLARVADMFLSPPTLWLLLTAQIVAAVLIIAEATTPPLWALCVVVAVRCLLNFRNTPALIGADQMQILVLVPCLLYAVAPVPAVARACGWFIALQLVIAYVTAGVSKLASADWRNGVAIAAVVRCRNTGFRHVFACMQRFPATARAACWVTMIFELTGPLLLGAGADAALAFIVLGAAFHIGIALVMGLDEFLWAYVAAYPVTLRCAFDLDYRLYGVR